MQMSFDAQRKDCEEQYCQLVAKEAEVRALEKELGAKVQRCA